jgi:hypothetical protein
MMWKSSNLLSTAYRSSVSYTNALREAVQRKLTSCQDTITCGLGLLKYRHGEDIPIVEAALEIVHCYVTRLLESGLLSDAPDVQNHISEDDSQEFGSDVFTDLPMEIFDYIGVCDPFLARLGRVSDLS